MRGATPRAVTTLKRTALRRATLLLAPYGVDPTQILTSVRARPEYRHNRAEFLWQLSQRPTGAAWPVGKDYPCLSDRADPAGVASGAYFHQDLWVARLVHAARPRRHIDVGSRVDGFVTHVASFRDIEVIDVRPQDADVDGIRFVQHDITERDERFVECCDSLSCLHALEHFGLGRYGDTIDVDGWRLGWDNLVDMVEPGGTLYVSVPIGPQRVEFDAHRVFALPTVHAVVTERCDVERFSYIDDVGNFHVDANLSGDAATRSFDCVLGCGIFALRRRRRDGGR